MQRLFVTALAVVLAAGLMLAGCAQATPAPAPTAAPAAPAKTAEPAKPAATTAPVAPTAAPKVAEPTKPAAQPTTAPAAKMNWPEKGKTMTIMVGYAAGGPNDLLTRIIAPGLEKVLGVTIQVVNKAGASSLIAIGDVAKSKPDGYTIGGIGLPTVPVAMSDPENPSPVQRKDLMPIANMVSYAAIMVVNPSSPYKTMKEVVDTAKAKPKSVKFSAIGQLGTGAMVGYFLEEVTGTKFSYVYFDSGAEAQTAVMGGHADVTSVNPIVAVPAIKSGQLVALASTGKVSTPLLPDVKTLQSQGYNVVVLSSWGFMVPVGTPKEIVSIMSDAVKQAMALDDVKKKLMESGNDLDYMDTAQFAAYWDQQEIDAKKGIAAARAQR